MLPRPAITRWSDNPIFSGVRRRPSSLASAAASNRAAIGALVTVSAGGRITARSVLSQSSYYSHDDLRLHFGLGAASRADQVEVAWPSGQVDRLRDVEGRRVVTLREGER